MSAQYLKNLDLNVDEALDLIVRCAQKHGYSEAHDTEKHIGFKRTRNNTVVILEITGKNNEDRISSLPEKLYAKMRCEEQSLEVL